MTEAEVHESVQWAVDHETGVLNLPWSKRDKDWPALFFQEFGVPEALKASGIPLRRQGALTGSYKQASIYSRDLCDQIIEYQLTEGGSQDLAKKLQGPRPAS